MTATPTRDAEATRQRLLTAAAAEFARYGIAGGRVDRIAAESRSNKAQIYHYFGSKEQLFDAVFEALVATTIAEVPMDATALGDYAGRLFDGYVKYPHIARLATWYRLERGSEQELIAAVVDSNSSKVAAIAAAQAAGAVTDAYTPEVLLGLVIHLAALWTSQTPEYDHLTRKLSTRKRRDVVVSAVQSLTTPD